MQCPVFSSYFHLMMIRLSSTPLNIEDDIYLLPAIELLKINDLMHPTFRYLVREKWTRPGGVHKNLYSLELARSTLAKYIISTFRFPTRTMLSKCPPAPVDYVLKDEPISIKSSNNSLFFQNSDEETALHCAAQHGHRDVVRALVSPRHGGAADPNIKNCREETPLDLASLYGR